MSIMRSLLLFLSLYACTNLIGQNLHPEITGDTILCPNESGELTTTEPYDTYQWYYRDYNDTIWTKFGNNGTERTIPITEQQVLSTFKVEVTENSDTAESDPVLVDQWVFLLPTVKTVGNFSIGSNGQTQFCPEDTVYYVLQAPYDTNITWFNFNNVIPGENDDTFRVMETGSYTVEGAPSVCPNYIQPLGVTLEAIEFSPKTPVLSQIYDSLFVEQANSFSTFTWYKDGQIISNAHSGYYLPTTAGHYSVVTADENGCSDTSNIIEYSPTGMDNLAENNLTITPNPANRFLHINAPSARIKRVVVYDANGRIMRSTKSSSEVDISTLQKGMYLLKIQAEKQTVTRKFIKD